MRRLSACELADVVDPNEDLLKQLPVTSTLNSRLESLEGLRTDMGDGFNVES